MITESIYEDQQAITAAATISWEKIFQEHYRYLTV